MHVVSDIQNSRLSGWICTQYQIFRIAGYLAEYAVQIFRKAGYPAGNAEDTYFTMLWGYKLTIEQEEGKCGEKEP